MQIDSLSQNRQYLITQINETIKSKCSSGGGKFIGLQLSVTSKGCVEYFEVYSISDDVNKDELKQFKKCLVDDIKIHDYDLGPLFYVPSTRSVGKSSIQYNLVCDI